jgi:hypothetical protein
MQIHSWPCVFCCSLTLAAFAQTPPHSGWNPPGAAAAQSLADSTVAAPSKDWLTLGEKTDFTETGHYQETVDFYHKLAAASPWVKVQTIAKTPQGRDLLLAIVSKGAPDRSKTIVMIQNGIHSGEIGGKDASEMLLRDIVLNKRYAALLDRVVILMIPVFNVDGHEQFSPYNRINQNGPKAMGLRATMQRLNLNRDYVKADAPEMRAWVKVYNDWMPDFLIDNHVTDGEDHQYDLTIAMPDGPDIAAPVGAWTDKKFLPQLDRRMTAAGHLMAPYGGMRANRYHGMIFEPRYSNGYAATRNRAALLVETHSLKTYKVQVWSHYDVMLHSLEILAADNSLRAAVHEADTMKLAGSTMYLAGRIGAQGDPFVFHGVASHTATIPLSGASYTVYEAKPNDVQTRIFNRIETTAQTVVPAAYIVPREWTVLTNLLAVHSVVVTRTPKDETREVELYRMSDPQWDEQPFEGHIRLAIKTAAFREKRLIPAGSIMVSTDQPNARIAINILEPQAPDSALQWGLLDSVVAAGEGRGGGGSTYVTEPLMQEFAASSPALRAEFEVRLKSDPKFAANSRERLAWWMERSPWLRSRDEYPVMRLMN